jgi:hypothetical protein
MVECIRVYHGLKEIVILDNASTYAPLLAWYKTAPCRVVYLGSNMGHMAPWAPPAQAQILTDQYVVTDPDLDLVGVPPNVLHHLGALLAKYPAALKMGLSLEVFDYNETHPYFAINGAAERSLWNLPIFEGVARKACVDTTFALYDKRIMNVWNNACGWRTLRPYTARHLPWYVREPTPEFAYYLEHANSVSCSYKPELKHLLETGRPLLAKERGTYYAKN